MGHASAVGADLVAETWISHGPRAADTAFDPQAGDRVSVCDDDEPLLLASVVRRELTVDEKSACSAGMTNAVDVMPLDSPR